MKNFKTILGTVLMTSLVFTSCNKNDDIEIIERPTAQEFSDIKDMALENKIQEFSFNAEDGAANFTSENGVDITIYGNCLTLNGDAVTGTVDVEFVELFEKGDMLTTNKPTMGLKPNGDKALLISGGEFFVEVTQNGVALETNCDFMLVIPSNLTGDEEPEMSLWNGIIDDEGNLAWEEVEKGPNGDNGVFAEGGAYYTFAGDFGWTNVDIFYNDPRPKTTILVDVPEGYDNENSAVYLSYDGQAPALANLDTYDSNTELFSEHYGQIPVGLECHVIFVSEQDGNWRYSIKSVTIVENGTITIDYDETAVVTQTQLVQLMNDLP